MIGQLVDTLHINGVWLVVPVLSWLAIAFLNGRVR